MKNRIHSKKDLNTYLICDEIAFTGHKLSTIRRILLCLARHQNLGLWFLKKNRRLEYRFNNRNKSPFHKLVYFLAGYRYVRWQHQYSCSIPVNVIGPGFRIWHFAQGSIIINDQAIIGTGCSISAGCCIGQAKEHAPIIGDACEICLNATKDNAVSSITRLNGPFAFFGNGVSFCAVNEWPSLSRFRKSETEIISVSVTLNQQCSVIYLSHAPNRPYS